MGNTNTVPRSRNTTDIENPENPNDDPQSTNLNNTVPRSHNTDLDNPENPNDDPNNMIPTSQNTDHDQPSNNRNNMEDEGNSNFICEICTEPILSINRFKNQNKCVHPYCTDCVAMHIRFRVRYHAFADIECPRSDCNELLDPLWCRTLISQDLFDKWCDNLCMSVLERLDKCYCPHPTCSALILNECGVTQGSSICPNCKGLFCFKCKMPWHADYRCAESGTVRDRNDVLFRKLSERLKWARCPGCGHCVERTEGCLIITCRCRTKFCYNCGEKRIQEVHRCPTCQPSLLARPLPVVPGGNVQPAAGAGELGVGVGVGEGEGRGGAMIINFIFFVFLLFIIISSFTSN